MSTDYDPDRYLPTIDAILSVADLEQITVKKIRNALQELFGIDFQPHKKEINDLILGRYYELLDKREEDVKRAKKEKEEMERKDALLAAKLLRDELSRAGGRQVRTRETRKSPKPRAKKERAPAPNNPFNREMVLSTELQDVLGVAKLSRPQVVKQLWIYIKDRNLQNPSDKRQINCDEKLQRLFKKKMVGAFEMNKILSTHIYKPEELSAGLTPVVTTKQEADDESDVEELSSA